MAKILLLLLACNFWHAASSSPPSRIASRIFPSSPQLKGLGLMPLLRLKGAGDPHKDMAGISLHDEDDDVHPEGSVSFSDDEWLQTDCLGGGSAGTQDEGDEDMDRTTIPWEMIWGTGDTSFTTGLDHFVTIRSIPFCMSSLPLARNWHMMTTT